MSQPEDQRDLVDVLRNCREGDWTPLLNRAADEIERLRSEVAELRTANAIWEQTSWNQNRDLAATGNDFKPEWPK